MRIFAGSRCLVPRAEMADSFGARLIGLLGRDALPAGAALVLRPSNLIHTWFMKFPIDVLFLDSRGHVVSAARRLQPFRIAWGGWKARTVVELPAGTIDEFGVTMGTPLRFVPDSGTDTLHPPTASGV